MDGGKMNKYSGPDEFPIAQIPDTLSWSENFAAMFASPSAPIAVYYGVGRWHSDPTLWRENIIISLPDQRLLFRKSYGRGGTRTSAGGSLTRYEILEPGNTVRLTMDGP